MASPYVIWAPDPDRHFEISKLVDEWLLLVAELPFFYLHSDATGIHGQWIISHALAQPG